MDKFWIELNTNFREQKLDFLRNNWPSFVVENLNFMPSIVNTTTHPDDVNFLDLWYSNNLTSELVNQTWSHKKLLFETLWVKKIKLAPLLHNWQKINWLPLNRQFTLDAEYIKTLPNPIKSFINRNKNNILSNILIDICEDENTTFRNKYMLAKPIIASLFWLNGDYENPKTKIVNSEFIKYIYADILWSERLPKKLNEYIISNIKDIIWHIIRQLIDINLQWLNKWQKEQNIYMTIKHWLVDYINAYNPQISDIYDNLWLRDKKWKVNIALNNQPATHKAAGSDNISDIYQSFANIANDSEFGIEFMDYVVKFVLEKKQWKAIELWVTNDGSVIYISPDANNYKIVKQSKNWDMYMWNEINDLMLLLTWAQNSTNTRITQFTNIFDAMHSTLAGAITIWSERWMRENILEILVRYLDFKWLSQKYAKYIEFIKEIKINRDNSLREWIANISTDEAWLFPSFNNRFPDSLYMCLLWPEVIWSREFTESYQNAETPFDTQIIKNKLQNILIQEKTPEIAEIC